MLRYQCVFVLFINRKDNGTIQNSLFTIQKIYQMATSLSSKTKTLSVENRQIFMSIAKKKFGLTTNQYRDRVLGRVDWALNQEVFLETCLEEIGGGKYQIKRTEEIFDLAGIPYPVQN